MRTRPVLTLLLFAGLVGPATAYRVAPPELGLKTFDAAWSIINRMHFDPDFNGVDWQAARDAFRPRAEAAESMASVRLVIQEMLALLGQSHFVLIEKEFLDGGSKSSKASPAGTVGFDIRMRENLAVVFRVEAGSPADLAGVLPGWILMDIDDTPMEELLADLANGKSLPLETMQRKGLLPQIDGEPGSTARFAFLTGLEEWDVLREVDLTRVERDAVPFDMPGLPTFYLTVRSERIEHEGRTIGLVHFSNWFHGISAEIDLALFSMRDCDGIILDLRGNSGGAGMMAGQVAGHFFTERGSLGTQRMRRRDSEYTFRPRRSGSGRRVGVFEGPLAILADETTGSCSEVFTGGMQALGRARVIGERSAGAALPATLTELPNGDYLLHAIADFITARGESMEGDGVEPDQEVALTREDLLAGRDAALAAALDWIATEAP